MAEGVFRRRHLPHWDVGDRPVFITACLAGSLPAVFRRRIDEYQRELEQRVRPEDVSLDEWRYRNEKLLFAFIDELLDDASPVKHLADNRLAEMVQNAILHFANERYRLLAFVVMPSHHHWLFQPDEVWAASIVKQQRDSRRPTRTPREIISHSLQSYTGTMGNRLLESTGQFWQSETFDHWVRDEAECYRIINYIENNPVKAGLAPVPEAWKYSSAHIRQQLGIPLGFPIPRP